MSNLSYTWLLPICHGLLRWHFCWPNATVGDTSCLCNFQLVRVEIKACWGNGQLVVRSRLKDSCRWGLQGRFGELLQGGTRSSHRVLDYGCKPTSECNRTELWGEIWRHNDRCSYTHNISSCEINKSSHLSTRLVPFIYSVLYHAMGKYRQSEHTKAVEYSTILHLTFPASFARLLPYWLAGAHH